MQCPECQSDNRKEARFCSECGRKFELVCPECGNSVKANSKFCDECGCNLSSPWKTTDTTTEPDSPPHHTSEQIENDDSAISVGERKHVTVLFSDLTGYTEMSEKLDPEEVKEITSTIFSELTNIIEKYDGFIEKYIGDAILAVFGAKQAFEDSALRAIKAAREIHAQVESASPRYEKLIGRPLAMHTGINTGLVVTGEINFQRGTHGLVGDTINTAARLMSISEPGDITVDYDSFAQTEGYFEFDILAPVKVKGKAEPILVYRVGRALQEPKKLHRLHGVRADLIGRSIEMQVLEDAVGRLEEGLVSFVGVCGTAGTGKSRLLHDFKKTIDLKKIQWLDANAYPYTQNIPYFPLIDLLTKAFGIEEGNTKEDIKLKVESGMKRLLGKDKDMTPYIGGLFSIEYSETSEVSPEYWKEQLFKAVHLVLKSLNRAGPVVICMEDMHWADPSFIQLLRSLLSDISGPFLFVFVYRPVISFMTDFEASSLNIDYTELRLKELSPSETQSMVSSLLKSDRIPKDLRRFIRDNVDGNPFYVEELINSLIDSDVLLKSSGEWFLKKTIGELQVSTTIQGVVAGRVDRLGYETKRLLQEASVIGRSFLYEILKRISDIGLEIDKSITILERLDLISAKSIQPTLEYIFKHALTQEIVYNGLLKSERELIHSKIGDVIEKLFQGRLAEFFDVLAYHYVRAGKKLKAVEFLVKSGEKSLKLFSLDESNQYFRSAYDILSGHQKRTIAENTVLIDLLNRWALVYYYKGNFKQLAEILSQHEELASKMLDNNIASIYYAWQGFAAWWTDDFDHSKAFLDKALDLSQKSGNIESKGYALTWLSWLYVELGEFEKAIKAGMEGNKIAISTNNHYLYFKSLGAISRCYFYRGVPKECLSIGRQLINYGQKFANIRCQVMGYWNESEGYIVSGDYALAVKTNKEAHKIAEDPLFKIGAQALLIMPYILSEKTFKAKEILDKEINYYLQCGNEHVIKLLSIFEGVILIDQGKFSKGLNLILDLKKRLIKIGRKGFIPIIELILGNIFLVIVQRKKPINLRDIIMNIGFIMKYALIAGKKAELHFLRAIDLSAELGSIGIMGQAKLGLGILYKEHKKYTKANKFLQESIEIFKDIEAPHFKEQASVEIQTIP